MGHLNAESLLASAFKGVASAAGSQLGGKVAGVVLSLIGIETDDLADVRKDLADIQRKLDAISRQINALEDTTVWTSINSDLMRTKTRIEPMFDEAATIVTGVDDRHTRDRRLIAALRKHDTDALHADMRELHAIVTGSSSGALRQTALPELFLKKFWHEFHGRAVGDDFSRAAGRIMDLFVVLGELQRKAAILLYNCYLVADTPQPNLAVAAMNELAGNLQAQYRLFLGASPTMMALYNMAPRVGETIAIRSANPSFASYPYLAPMGPLFIDNEISTMSNQPKPDNMSFGYLPDQNNPARFALWQGLGSSFDSDVFQLHAVEVIVQHASQGFADPVTGVTVAAPTPEERATVQLLMAASNTKGAGKPVWFHLVPTARPNEYLIRADNGRYLSVENRGIAGTFAQLVSATSGTSGNWILETRPQAQLIASYAQY